MKNEKTPPLFFGAATALCTPFTETGEVDYIALSHMIEYQIAGNIDAIVLCGTTGEAATLTEDEYHEVVMRGIEMIGGRVPAIVGCGSPSTAYAVKHAIFAQKCGADAILLVTPYYNRGTRDGIRTHFETVAEAGGLPTIFYHVPARTGVQLSCEDILKMTEHPLITGIKDATGDITLFSRLAAAAGDRLALYSGNDALTLPCLSLGGAGVISVISNLFPQKLHDICRLFREGKSEEARALHLSLVPFMDLLFRETSPAPIKHALASCGLCRDVLRLPLTRTSEGLAALLDGELTRISDE